jgi:hypothetical protein
MDVGEHGGFVLSLVIKVALLQQNDLILKEFFLRKKS